MYIPDGLLTSGCYKHDVGPDPDYITPDPLASDDCLDVFSPVYQFLPLEPEELNTMNPSEDEPSSGLNGRLRPRKSAIPSPLSIKQIVNKYDGKQAQEKPKRSSTPSKASPSKQEDLCINSNPSPTPQLLCPYCDKKFGSKQTVSKHIRRLHLSTSKVESSIICLFCNHVETEPSDIIRHMIDSHPNQYFACLDCHTRFPSTKELAEHKLNICEKQKITYRNKLRRKTTKKSQKILDSQDKDDYSGHSFNGIVISCELKPTHIHDEADIEDNITTNLILPPSKNISTSAELEKNAVIVLDDIQWNRRIPSNFSFHNTDADQILSRLGVVHRSPKTGESTKKDWFRAIEDATQKFEKCFDTSFYSKVASNVQENLTKFLDGSFNFNPDADSTIKTRKSKNSVVINTAEGFPILLAGEQFSRNNYDGFLPRTIAPKHKWKWDNLETEKCWNPDQIKRDTHANNCIITLVSSLDIWTQLRMRRKFEEKFNITPIEKKTEKQNVTSKELKEILESREIPESTSQIAKYVSTPLPITTGQDFPTSLGLIPSVPDFNLKPAILSGEWVRPRCYVCCACGAQSRDSRALSVHVSSKHPNAQVQHYEIVGDSLLKADILKHLYVPPNQNVNRTRPPRGFRDCTKCMKSITIEDLHQHMLDCAGDTPAVRRKCRYRPFGVRRRRPRLPDNRIRKKMRNDIRSRPTRQKKRLRSKPKIRSEVGDAETIRKMLADLPAKRHRVLVNPLNSNSILRPRRKLDKQRAMLMLRRHASEDLKSKPKPSKTNLRYDHQQTASNIDRYKSVCNRDDEDNQPLKSRLKRVACKITRQKESLNRKAMLKKTKRKVCVPIEKNESEGVEKQLDVSMSCPINVQTDEISVKQTEKRINVNGDPQNTRENSSGRGDANNDQRDNQRPGFSGQNGNSQNVFAPAQNVPLKHSIARLTANSETHDKSVQFHHLFLVQQECNNTNEHVPTGQRVLFENEAVVTKLDKPPLHFHQNISLETVQEHNTDTVLDNSLECFQMQTLDAIQKNKLNKPRKGLNDCIAMLKNKLVDTDPNAPAHVSVQCGTDDLLSPDPVVLSNSTLISPRVDAATKAAQAYPSTQQPKKTSKKSLARTEQLPKPLPLYHGQYLNHDMYRHANIERQTTQWRPVNYDAIMPRFIDNHPRKETSRRRSASQHENLYFAQQLLSVTPPNDDMLFTLSADPVYNNAYNFPPRKSPKSYPEQFNVENINFLSKYGKRKVYDKNPTETSNGSLQNCGKIVNNQNRKSLDSLKKSTRTRMSTPRKPVEILEKHINIRKDVSKNTKVSNETNRTKSLDSRLHRELPINISEERKNDNYSQIIRRKRNSNVNPEKVSLSQFKQVEVQLNADVNVKTPINVYNEHNLHNNTVSIPLAHASTNVESMLSVPLDLSSKTLSVDTNYSSRHDEILLANLDKYETLDLSNKRRTRMEHLCEDEVVDLRVKHNSEYPLISPLKPPYSLTSQQELSSITAFNLVHQSECVPTDLSLKKRKEDDTNLFINLSEKRKNLDEDEIQDLSKNKMKDISARDPLVLDDELPTDLSNKNTITTEDITLAVKESNKSDSNASKGIVNEECNVNEQDESNHLLEIAISEKLNNSSEILLTPDKCLISEESKHEIPENINYEDETLATSETSISDGSLSQNQKAIYDTTLRIPQYKIRPIGSDSTPKETNESAPCITPSTCVESYSADQTSINSTTESTCISHNSSEVNNSMVVSVEAQERITYSYTNSMVVSSVTGPLPTYSSLNCETTPFTTFESTEPVYTLSNACISMAINEVSRNCLLSIPSTTIISTAPVYTLAGTTLVTPFNCVTLPNSGQPIPYPPPCGSYLPEIDSEILTHYTSPSSTYVHEERSFDNNTFIRGAMFNFERDQEISRQVVLPKEIMEILNDMPFDHRHHLLQLLLHYVTPLRPVPILSTQISLFQNAGLSELAMPVRLSRELAVDASTDTEDIQPLHSLPIVEDPSRVEPNLRPSNALLNSAVHHEDSDFENQIIDLTYDEIIPKIDSDIEVNEEQRTSTEEIPPPIAPASNIPKINNEKTSSLRAVRIKAPSERQQLKMTINPFEILPCSGTPVVPNVNQDNQLIQSIDTEISTEIQMYEVSSTQSGKNKLSNTIFTCNATPHPMCNNVMKSLSGVVVNEQVKDSQYQLLKPGPAVIPSLDTNLICHEWKDYSAGTENINLNINKVAQGSIESHLKGTYTNSDAISVFNIHEPLMTNDLKRIDNDDDSDDNISLAVIVRQKQLKQNKLKVPNLDNEINSLKSNVTHVKQTDKVISPENINKVEVDLTVIGETNALKNTDEPSFSIDELQNISGDSIEVKSKRLKKKGKKNHNDSVKKVKIHDKKGIKTIKRGLDITKENDHVFENVETGPEINVNLNSKHVVTDETFTIMPSKEIQMPKNEEIPTASFECMSDVQEESAEKNEMRLEHKEENKNVRNSTQNAKLLETFTQEGIHNNNELSAAKKSFNKQDCSVQQVDNGGSLEDNNGTLEINMSVSSDVKLCNEEDILLPLRRSKRGKSLFTECNEQALICQDTFLGQKTPLTKKQLIFSKLLLDEEKNQQTSALVDDNQMILEENCLCLQDKSDKSTEEKHKSIKRKKSPHSKRKSKKKKSIDSSEHITSDDDDAKTFFKENSSLENDDDNKLSAIENYRDSNTEDSGRDSKDRNAQSQIKFDTDNDNELTSDGINVFAEQNNTVLESTVKRKIEPSINDHLETSTHSSKPKKSKSNNVHNILDALQTQTAASDKNSHSESNSLPLAARRARSKSVVVKSSGSLLYDPYDIDLEDMGDETEPFRKQRSMLPKSGISKLTKESQLQTMCTTNENVTNTEPDFALNDIATKIIAAKDCKEIVSDSDESSKSDVPLMKYVEEKEKKNQLCESGITKFIHQNINEENSLNDDDAKPSRKKHKRNKGSPALIDKVQIEDKDDKAVSEEQRSEQFMESFGFFSERKPRKSNLLATKKISETFHIIANESDDLYMDTRERTSKKSSRSESKKAVEEENYTTHSEPSNLTKLPAKCDESLSIRSATLYCHLCKKEFQRIDNLVRHQMTLLHASKLSGNTVTPGNLAAPDDFNCLVIFKEHLDRLRILQQKMKSKKQSKTKFTLPTLQQVLLDVRKAVREKQLARRNLSRDQALFLDCCELLKDSNRDQNEDRNISGPLFPCCPSSYALACTSAKEYDPKSGLSLQFSRYAKCDTSPNLAKKPIIHTSARLSGMANFVPLSSTSKQASSTDRYAQPSNSTSGLDSSCKTFAPSKPGVIGEIIDEKDDSKSEGDVDSITAQNILESEEVRNLEHDLISGLKETACKFQPLLGGDKLTQKNIQHSAPEVDTYKPEKKETSSKLKSSLEAKEKKNLDIIENIDIFEDKFDKIKRKCRSQAAAAKLVQTSIEPSTSYKSRKKSDKKKGKRNFKKHNRNTVLTKGALKGFDSIKVSILTSDIDMSSIVPPIVTSSKKKKKRSSKKKRDRKHLILTRKLDSNASKESSQKNIDVYEFLDNEEPEIFELRPSTVMERFRNLTKKKDLQSTLKIAPNCEEALSSESVSDGDDFVYMSDDYVCSDDETENSLLSCELSNVKGSNEVKKSFSPLKRKDVMEKNAVMGKIFKHNAVRSEKKSAKPKESVKPKANLDQLFDSLLEEEPNSSVLMNDDESTEKESCIPQKKRVFSPIVLSKYDLKSTNNDSSQNIRSPSPALSSDSAVSRRISSFLSQQSSPRRLSSSRHDNSSPFDYRPSTSKKYDDLKKCGRISKDYKLTPTKKYDITSENKYDLPIPNNIHINESLVMSPESDNIFYNSYDRSTKDRTLSRKKETVAQYGTSYDFKPDYYHDDAFSDDAGVARQRARRKCTVGKQNILAETWSSESELDCVPPRPNSAESVVLNVGRKRKGKKRDGQVCGGRKGNKHVSVKKQDFESRVSSSNRNTGTSGGGAGTRRSSGGSTAYTQQLSLPGPSGIGPRLRPTTSFWADGNEEPEHVQQHGWIVGDSHKKLVTMLAHAKGRKRNNDDKVRLME